MSLKQKIKYEKAIVPLNINNLHGRMLREPSKSKKNREILLVYGHHASIERMIGFVEELTKYGNVTLPDLPGFGGMESFYKLNEKPTLDNLADYLAAFIKLRYKRRRITILGMSLGFLIVTRMLQKYPDIAKRVDILVSVVGFAHREDFILPKRIRWPLRITASVFSNKYPALFMKTFILRGPIIRACYSLVASNHSKLKDADVEEQNNRINFEIGLWQINDIRTYMDTTITMLRADTCDVQVAIPVHHVAVDVDRYFDNHRVEQHLGVIYSHVYVINAKQKTHAPTVVATAKEAAPFIPPALRKLLSKS
jgi:pimeloyl-ACP methyl ester carboxylesterase